MLATVLRRSHCQLQAYRSWPAAFRLQTRSPAASSSDGSSRGFAAKYGGTSNAQVRHLAWTSPVQAEKKKRASKRVKARRVVSAQKQPDLSPAEHQLLTFLEAIENVDIKNVISLYHGLQDGVVGKQVLEREHAWRIAQCLHEAFRREKRTARDKGRRADTDELVKFAEQLGKDIRRDRLAPDHRAHFHLLALFKESGVRDAGVRFWDWLRSQDERFVNADVYGAAIELLATDGVPLPELEALFQEALTRFPDNFHAYHLSPDAIVPDREQPTTVKGLSMILLQGILTARVLNGDTRNAYLALDTALRLYPALTPPRFFAVLAEERPLVEAYTLLTIACRAGILPTIETTRRVLTALRNSSDLSSPAAHIAAIRAMLSVLYMQLGAGGFVSSNMVNEIVISITQILRLRGVGKLAREDMPQVVGSTLDMVRKLLEVTSRYGVKPGISAFNSIITNIAGFGQSRQVINTALQDVQSLGLEPTIITRRSIVTTAGLMQDASLLKKSWSDLKRARTERGEKPDATDFHVLVKAAKLCSEVHWAKQTCRSSALHLQETDRSSLYERLLTQSEIRDPHPSKDTVDVDVPQLLAGMERVQADLNLLNERTEDRPTHQDFSAQDLPMMLRPQHDGVNALSEHELWKLYDELTAEQSQQAQTEPDAEAVETKPPAVSSTNIPLGKLRYENWKSINYLLELADKNDKQYVQAVDEAIAAGMAPPQRALGFDFGNEESSQSYGLSDVGVMAHSAADYQVQHNSMDAHEVDGLRSEILRLRGRLPKA